jgi:hypothetical protein
VRTVTAISEETQRFGEIPTEVTLAIAFLLPDEAAEIELVAALVTYAATEEAEAVVPAGTGVADTVPEEELPACTAGRTSSCFPAIGSVLRPQLTPAPLSVFPYMRQMS